MSFEQSNFNQIQSILPFFEQMFKGWIKDSFKEVLGSEGVKDLIKAKELPAFLTVSEAMDFLKIKSLNTFNAKVEKYQLEIHYNKMKNNQKTFKKEDIFNIYVSEGKFFKD